MPGLRAGLLLFVLPLAVVAGHIDEVTVEKNGERYLVEGQIVIDASVGAVYKLITDYDALEKLDKGIAESRLIERIDSTTALVYTKLKGCIVVFCRKVERVERVEEISATEIVASVVPGENGNVRYEQSRWELSDDGQGTRIVFRTEVEPDFWIPPFIGPKMIGRVLKRRVSAVLHTLEQTAGSYE